MTTLMLMGIGAALMYFFDPDSGRRRRERLRDRCTSATKKLQGSAPIPAYLSNRTPAVPEKPSGDSDDQTTNEILVNRVQTQMGRVVSQPTAVAVTADQGRVTLSGPVSAEEQTALLACVRSVPGVTSVENRLDVTTAATV